MRAGVHFEKGPALGALGCSRDGGSREGRLLGSQGLRGSGASDAGRQTAADECWNWICVVLAFALAPVLVLGSGSGWWSGTEQGL